MQLVCKVFPAYSLLSSGVIWCAMKRQETVATRNHCAFTCLNSSSRLCLLLALLNDPSMPFIPAQPEVVHNTFYVARSPLTSLLLSSCSLSIQEGVDPLNLLQPLFFDLAHILAALATHSNHLLHHSLNNYTTWYELAQPTSSSLLLSFLPTLLQLMPYVLPLPLTVASALTQVGAGLHHPLISKPPS